MRISIKKVFTLTSVVFLFINYSFSQSVSSHEAKSRLFTKALNGDLGEIYIYQSNSVIQKTSDDSTLLLGDGKEIVYPYEYNWVFFLDDEPLADWNHSCRYFFVNAMTSRYSFDSSDCYPKYLEEDFEIVFDYEYCSSEYRVPWAAYSLCTGDLDLDGDEDIVVGHHYNFDHDWGGISILENDGTGRFILVDSLKFSGGQTHVEIVNLDTDEHPEIIVKHRDSEESDEKIAIVYNYDLNDVLYFSLSTNEGVGERATGDIDNDNDVDIVIASNQGQFWGVLYNDGTGQFSSPEYYSVGHPVDLKCADLNNDNRDDVIVCGPLQVFFSDSVGFDSVEIDSFVDEVEIADMDGDGDLDMVGLFNIYLIGYTGITVYENIGGSDFIVHDEFLFQPPLSYFKLSDINNDGLPDVVCTAFDGLYILENQGNYILSDPYFIEIYTYGMFLQNSVCADLDGNGYDDIISVRYCHGELPANVNILFNDGSGKFSVSPLSVIKDNHISISKDFQLYQNYPNPFNNNTVISYRLYKESDMTLTIYTLTGSLVKSYKKSHQNVGEHIISWDGTDQLRKEVSSGVYLYALRVGSVIVSKKMVLLQ